MLELNKDEVAVVVGIRKEDLAYLKDLMERNGLSLDHLQRYEVKHFIKWLKERELPST